MIKQPRWRKLQVPMVTRRTLEVVKASFPTLKVGKEAFTDRAIAAAAKAGPEGRSCGNCQSVKASLRDSGSLKEASIYFYRPPMRSQTLPKVVSTLTTFAKPG